MADDGRGQSCLFDCRVSPGDGVGKPRDRDAHICRPDHRTRATGARRGQGVMASAEQPVALVGIGGHGKVPPAQIPADGLDGSALVLNDRLAAVEFDEQRRQFGQVEVRIDIAGTDCRRIEQLHARHRHPLLDGGDNRRNRAFDGVEGETSGEHMLGNAVQPQRRLYHQPKRSLRAGKQVREVVASRRLARPRSCLDQRAIREHHFERQHRLAHRAIAHCIGA